MPTEQEWRDKYREVLSRLAADEARWSKTQNVLKLLIGRLCLAAQGRDDRLDRRARASRGRRAQADRCGYAGRADLRRCRRPLPRWIAPTAGARTADTGARSGLDAPGIEPPPPDAQARVAGRRAARRPPTPRTSIGSPSRPPSSGSLRHCESGRTADGFGATAVLDRLALLPELKPIVGDLRSRKHDKLESARAGRAARARHASFATEQRMQVQKEKLELQNIVQQLASRLDEISQHLTGDLADRSAGQDDCEQLNPRVTDEVTQLRLTAESANDITVLRQQLSSRLDAISSHLTDFRSREETRVRTYQGSGSAHAHAHRRARTRKPPAPREPARRTAHGDDGRADRHPEPRGVRRSHRSKSTSAGSASSGP